MPEVKFYPSMVMEIGTEDGDILEIALVINKVENTLGVNPDGSPIYRVGHKVNVTWKGNVKAIVKSIKGKLS